MKKYVLIFMIASLAACAPQNNPSSTDTSPIETDIAIIIPNLMKDLNPSELAKMPGKTLREFLFNSNEKDEISVIVEIDIPEPQVEFNFATMRPSRMKTLSVEEEAEIRQRFNQAHTALIHILRKSPRFLRTAHAFVITVTPTELHRVIQLPLIRAVKPNRVLKIK